MKEPIRKRTALRNKRPSVAAAIALVAVFALAPACSSETDDADGGLEKIAEPDADQTQSTAPANTTTTEATPTTAPDGRTLPKTQIKSEGPDDPELQEPWEAYVHAQEAFLDTVNDPSSVADLADWATETLMKAARGRAAGFAADGVRGKEPADPRFEMRYVSGILIDPQAVEFSVCVIDDWLLVDATTDEVRNSEVAIRSEVSVMRFSEGVWLWDTNLHDGQFSCA